MKRLLLVLLLIPIITVFATTKSDLKDAVSLYKNKHFIKSAKKFEEVLNNVKNPDIYYNLGNAYYKAGNIGKAILNYKRSLYLKWNKDCANNLSLSLSQTRDNISENKNIFEKWLFKQNINNWIIISLFVLTLFSLFISRMILKRHFRIIPFSILLLLTLLVSSITTIGIYTKNKKEAVVLSVVTGVQSAPVSGETVSFKLHEGAIVEILKEQGNWMRIMLPNGLSGWVMKSDIGII